jgi:hypothetical protein
MGSEEGKHSRKSKSKDKVQKANEKANVTRSPFLGRRVVYECRGLGGVIPESNEKDPSLRSG